MSFEGDNSSSRQVQESGRNFALRNSLAEKTFLLQLRRNLFPQ